MRNPFKKGDVVRLDSISPLDARAYACRDMAVGNVYRVVEDNDHFVRVQAGGADRASGVVSGWAPEDFTLVDRREATGDLLAQAAQGIEAPKVAIEALTAKLGESERNASVLAAEVKRIRGGERDLRDRLAAAALDVASYKASNERAQDARVAAQSREEVMRGEHLRLLKAHELVGADLSTERARTEALVRRRDELTAERDRAIEAFRVASHTERDLREELKRQAGALRAPADIARINELELRLARIGQEVRGTQHLAGTSQPIRIMGLAEQIRDTELKMAAAVAKSWWR